MTKQELIDDVATRAGLGRSDAQRAVESTVAVIAERMAAGEEIAISGFGKFATSERAARRGRNPQTGEEVEIPATRAARFSASAPLKRALAANGAR